MRDFRFGFTLGIQSLRDLAETCASAEAYGYDVGAAIDHLDPGRTAPFQGLLAASHACERLRLSTYTLNLGFWNPLLLAREVTSSVRLTGGRLELGLGCGLVKEEFDDAGFPFHPFAERIDKIARTLDVIEEALDQTAGITRPPVLIGGVSKRAIRLAVERGDIASFGGRIQVPGEEPGTLRLMRADETDERVAYFRELAASRADEMELNAFMLMVEVTDDRVGAIERFAAETDRQLLVPDIEAALESPYLLIGTEEEIAEQILKNRERYGFSYLSVQRPHMHVLGPIIKQVRSAK